MVLNSGGLQICLLTQTIDLLTNPNYVVKYSFSLQEDTVRQEKNLSLFSTLDVGGRTILGENEPSGVCATTRERVRERQLGCTNTFCWELSLSAFASLSPTRDTKMHP